MIWLTWRQFRAQAAAVYALVAVLVAVLVIAGRPVVTAGDEPFSEIDKGLYFAGIVMMYVLPALIGIFWGAPLVARELEAGTHRLVWNQTVTRSRWLVTKLVLIGLVAVAAAGLLSLAVTWWTSPADAASVPATIGAMPDNPTPPATTSNAVSMGVSAEIAPRVSPLIFGARGIVPIGYAAFAFVLGVAVGILVRRIVPAMAVTLVALVAIQLGMPFVARPYVLPPKQQTVVITMDNLSHFGMNSAKEVEKLSVAGPAGAWVLSNVTVDAKGRVVKPPAWVGTCALGPPEMMSEPPPDIQEQCFEKFATAGYRQRITYQPADRFWSLQWLELAILLALSALLAGLSTRWVGRRLS